MKPVTWTNEDGTTSVDARYIGVEVSEIIPMVECKDLHFADLEDDGEINRRTEEFFLDAVELFRIEDYFGWDSVLGSRHTRTIYQLNDGRLFFGDRNCGYDMITPQPVDRDTFIKMFTERFLTNPVDHLYY
jgi:hypothetical protein